MTDYTAYYGISFGLLFLSLIATILRCCVYQHILNQRKLMTQTNTQENTQSNTTNGYVSPIYNLNSNTKKIPQSSTTENNQGESIYNHTILVTLSPSTSNENRTVPTLDVSNNNNIRDLSTYGEITASQKQRY